MGVVDRKISMFERIVRLRGAERRHPDDENIVAVRADLERELGTVVSRSLAARILGVSHTALQRWVATGDLPIVTDENGRTGVPVVALTELYEEVLRQRGEDGGLRRGHVLEAALSGGRQRAASLRPRDLVNLGEELDAHDRALMRSLAYHRAVARRLGRPMIDQARHQLWQWQAEGRMDPRHAAAWADILRRPVPEVRRALVEDSPAAADRRQNSPFAGVLSEAERRKILQEIR